jgi:hypothetical protein
MSDKSPRQQLSQKSGKSLKEKRAAKKAKQPSQVDNGTPRPHKQHRGS